MISPVRGADYRQKPWEGIHQKKPWDYKVTAVIPVIDPDRELEIVTDLVQLQTEKPFLILIDTGSKPHLARALRHDYTKPDSEIHFIRLNGVRNPSDYPAMAMDLAFTLCRTPFLFTTHSDVFLRKRTVIEELLALCREHEVVGYEMSPRQHPDWEGMVSHTCSMFDMGTMDEIGGGWSLRRLVKNYGGQQEPDPGCPNWPDTELLINYLLRDNGIAPYLIGKETNYERNITEHFDHCRSLTSSKLYSNKNYLEALSWLNQASKAGKKRVEEWKKEISTCSV